MGGSPTTIIAFLVALTSAFALGAFLGVRLAHRRRRKREPELKIAPAQPDAQSHPLASKLLELQNITVDDIMIPRSEIASIDVSDDWDTILDALRSTPHTRLPVCRDNLDNIVGILN